MANPSTAATSTATARDLFALFAAGADASLQTAFDIQNSYLTLSRTAIERYADLTHQVQDATLKNLKASTSRYTAAD
jgi:hypothetical protein